MSAQVDPLLPYCTQWSVSYKTTMGSAGCRVSVSPVAIMTHLVCTTVHYSEHTIASIVVYSVCITAGYW